MSGFEIARTGPFASQIADYRKDGFEEYVPVTTEKPVSLVAFFATYVVSSIVLTLLTIIVQSRKAQRAQQRQAPHRTESTMDGSTVPEQEMVDLSPQNGNNQMDPTQLMTVESDDIDNKTEIATSGAMAGTTVLEHRSNGEPERATEEIRTSGITHAAAIQYDREEHQRNSNGIARRLSNTHTHQDRTGETPIGMGADRSRGRTADQPTATRRASLYSEQAWELAASRRVWGHSVPLRRADMIRRSVEAERQSQLSEEGSHTSRRSRSTLESVRAGSQRRHRKSRTVSDAAGSVLSQEMIEGEADFYRQRYVTRSRNRHRDITSMSDTSLMPPLPPDVLSPDDAADAHDVGRAINMAAGYQQNRSNKLLHTQPFRTIFSLINVLLDLAEQDYETRRVLSLAIPSTIAAMSEPVFKWVLIAIITHSVKDTDSMTAFVLVVLLIRVTSEEISGAVTDVQSNLVKDALLQGGDHGFREAGRYVQLAMCMQIVVGGPVLLIWVFSMEKVVAWFLPDDEISEIPLIAGKYAEVIVINYFLRDVTKAFMLPFHLSGQAHFERNVDVIATFLTIVAIAVVAARAPPGSGAPSLYHIGWIQVIIGVAKTIIKFGFVFMRGWLQPYQQGLLGPLTLLNLSDVTSYLVQVFPLFLGSLVEIGEWDILILFVRHLGSAEVASWASMGVIWEVCLAATEGLGEAASVRVSYHLVEGAYDIAKVLSRKVAFLAFIEAMIITSILLIIGPNITTSLTRDSVLQTISNEMMGLTALANIPMTLAQVYWSLVGAQGKYGVASATILFSRWFVTIPMSAIFVYGFHYQESTLTGAIAIGYATAAFVLSTHVFAPDWSRFSFAAEEDLFAIDEDEDDEDIFGSDDTSSI